jgi:hypothetical protein
MAHKTTEAADDDEKHNCSVVGGYNEIEFRRYKEMNDARVKGAICSDCEESIKDAMAHACTKIWMGEGNQEDCKRPFLCQACFQKRNASSGGRRQRAKKQRTKN